MNETTKEIEHYTILLENQMEILPENHSDILATMSTLAFTSNKMGHYEFALELYYKLLDIQQTVNSNVDEDVLRYMNNIAATYYNLGRYDDALQMYKETLEKSKEL